MNRKLEILIGLLIIVSLIGFIGVNVFSATFDKDIVITKISEAIAEKNIDYLKDYIEIEGIGNSLSREKLSEIVEILRDNHVHNNLSRYYDSTEQNIYLKRAGKEKLILDKYVLVLKPYDLKVESNMSEVKIFLDDEEIGSVEKDSNELIYSNLLPGQHKIRALYEGEYVNLQIHDEFTCFNLNNDEVYVYLPLDPYYINLYSNREDATLYINGKDTDISLSEVYTLGPVPTDGSMNVSAKVNIDGDTYESEKVNIDGSRSYYELYIDYIEPVEENFEGLNYLDATEKIKKAMDDYQYGMVEAINNGDYYYVGAFIEEGSPLMTSQKNLVKHLSSKGTREELIDYTIHNMTEVSEGIYEVQVTETHNIFYSSGKTDKVSNTWIYTVIENNDSFYLRDLRR